jgi:NTE family protein
MIPFPTVRFKYQEMSSSPKIALALGSGASRGWSHIGVINALLGEGIEPDVVCGTSVGAVVGASYVAGNLASLQEWVLESSRSDVYRFFDIKFSQSGFVDLDRLSHFLHEYVAAAELNIEDLPKPFIAVSTDLNRGREVWAREGNVAEAVRASMSLPGLFPPVRNQGRWLVDGGLVNPVPVTACHALGADVVIAVNLNSDIVGKRQKRTKVSSAREEAGLLQNLKRQAKEYSNSLFSSDDEDDPPGLLSAVSSSINIFQDRITRSRLAGDPADILISPKLSDVGLLEFGKAQEAISTGEDCVKRALSDIRSAIGATSA